MTEHPRAEWLVEKHDVEIGHHHWPIYETISGEPWDKDGQYRVQVALDMYTETANTIGPTIFLDIFKDGVHIATVPFGTGDFSVFVSSLVEIDSQVPGLDTTPDEV